MNRVNGDRFPFLNFAATAGPGIERSVLDLGNFSLARSSHEHEDLDLPGCGFMRLRF